MACCTWLWPTDWVWWQRYQGYFAPRADNQMLSMKLCGPTLGNDSVELVADWSKADIG